MVSTKKIRELKGKTIARAGGPRPSDKKSKLAKEQLGVSKKHQKSMSDKVIKHTKAQTNDQAEVKAINVLMRQLKNKRSTLSKSAVAHGRKARSSRRNESKAVAEVLKFQKKYNSKSAKRFAYNKELKNRRAAQLKRAKNSAIGGVSTIVGAVRGVGGAIINSATESYKNVNPFQ